MDCDEARSVLSAVFDDEAAPAEASAADAHVAGCRRCRDWVSAVHGHTRSIRLEEAGVTDLTAPVMAEWDRAHPQEARRAVAVRLGLLLMGLIELVLAVPLLFEARPPFLGPVAEHAGRELGAFGVTLAAAFLLAAWDGRARGRLELVATAIALLVVTGLTDLLHAETAPHSELAHVPSVLGLGFLWLLSRREPAAERPRPGFGRRDPAGIGRAA
jgi:predicted anti-sigma-YlaC factor YlaD